jgi:hypothetical protein
MCEINVVDLMTAVYNLWKESLGLYIINDKAPLDIIKVEL